MATTTKTRRRSYTFTLGGPGHFRLLTRPGRAPRLQRIGRWALPWLGKRQPRPEKTQVLDTGAATPGQTMLVRDWRPEDARLCKLCWFCNAHERRDKPGVVTCMRLIPADVPAADLPLYSERPKPAE